MFSYLVLMLGGLLMGAMVYRYNTEEREPWWMLVSAVIAGALATAVAVGIKLAVVQFAGVGQRELLHAVLDGATQELAKLAVPAAILLLVRKYFNDPMGGLLYGSLAGLGTALFEAAWWQWYAEESANAIATQGPTAMRLLLHTLWGGIVGSALGLIIMKKPWRQTLAQRVGLVMLIHFSWDYFIRYVPNGSENNWHRLGASLLLGTSVIWYGLLIVQANKWSRSLHEPTSKQRLLGRIVKMIITRRIR